jgi:hypothetical protein
MNAPKTRGAIWPLIALVAATIPVAGVFTLSRIFFIRDLALAFRSRFLFLRHSVWSGSWPLWDPYVANGQPAVGDALYQLFHYPSLLIRLLLPAVPAYNVWIALPVPLAALGAYLYLTRHVTRPAAALGAIAFAVAGPTVSTTNFPNLSWTVACVPFVFWTLDRLAERRRAIDAAGVAIIVSAQALAGEPVTLGATLAIAAAYVAWPLGGLRDWRLLWRCAAAMLLGVALASIQFVPLAVTSRASVRAVLSADDFWSLHPFAMFELIVPHFFGEYFRSNLAELTWMTALNSGREPFYYSMYMGAPVMIGAALAVFSRRPRTIFWSLVVLGCILASMGAHTPFYPVLQALVPGIKAFRFPVKYLSIAAMGISTLAALACDWMIRSDVPRVSRRVVIAVSLALAALAYGFIAWQMLAPRVPLSVMYRLAQYVGVRSPIQGAEFLIFRARPLLTALFLKVLCATFLFAVASSRRPERRIALAVFWGLAAIDLVAANSTVNPTMELGLLGKPVWLSTLPPDLHERVYFGGRIEGFVDVRDVDAPKYIAQIPGYPPNEQRYITVNDMVFHPSGWRLRESLSYDLPLLFPLENTKTLNRFETAPREDRLRFLARVGTRYATLPLPRPPGAAPIASVIGAEQLKLYEIHPDARRVYVVADALSGPSPEWAIEGLFQPRFNPAAGVLVSEPPPPPAGLASLPVRASAEFVDDGLNRVVVQAGLPADGYLVLLDSYNPSWQVDVDGAPAPLMRGDGLFRAVHLRTGSHRVTFTYRPRMFYIGAGMTGAAALVLALWCLTESRRRRRAL